MKLIKFMFYFVFIINILKVNQLTYSNPLEDDKPNVHKKNDNKKIETKPCLEPLITPRIAQGVIASDSRSSGILAPTGPSSHLVNMDISSSQLTLPVMSNEIQSEGERNITQDLFFQVMHRDILQIILSYLNPQDIMSFLSTCKTLNEKWAYVSELDNKNTRIPNTFINHIRKQCNDLKKIKIHNLIVTDYKNNKRLINNEFLERVFHILNEKTFNNLEQIDIFKINFYHKRRYNPISFKVLESVSPNNFPNLTHLKLKNFDTCEIIFFNILKHCAEGKMKKISEIEINLVYTEAKKWSMLKEAASKNHLIGLKKLHLSLGDCNSKIQDIIIDSLNDMPELNDLLLNFGNFKKDTFIVFLNIIESGKLRELRKLDIKERMDKDSLISFFNLFCHENKNLPNLISLGIPSYNHYGERNYYDVLKKISEVFKLGSFAYLKNLDMSDIVMKEDCLELFSKALLHEKAPSLVSLKISINFKDPKIMEDFFKALSLRSKNLRNLNFNYVVCNSSEKNSLSNFPFKSWVLNNTFFSNLIDFELQSISLDYFSVQNLVQAFQVSGAPQLLNLSIKLHNLNYQEASSLLLDAIAQGTFPKLQYLIIGDQRSLRFYELYYDFFDNLLNSIETGKLLNFKELLFHTNNFFIPKKSSTKEEKLRCINQFKRLVQCIVNGKLPNLETIVLDIRFAKKLHLIELLEYLKKNRLPYLKKITIIDNCEYIEEKWNTLYLKYFESDYYEIIYFIASRS